MEVELLEEARDIAGELEDPDAARLVGDVAAAVDARAPALELVRRVFLARAHLLAGTPLAPPAGASLSSARAATTWATSCTPPQ